MTGDDDKQKDIFMMNTFLCHFENRMQEETDLLPHTINTDSRDLHNISKLHNYLLSVTDFVVPALIMSLKLYERYSEL